MSHHNWLRYSTKFYSSRSVSNINSKYGNWITNLFPMLLMLKYSLLWNNGGIIYDVVSCCLEFEDESKYCVKIRIKPNSIIRKAINMSKICKWRDNLHMNVIFSIWRFNFIAIWNLAGMYIFLNFILLWSTRDSTIEYTSELYMYNSSKGF